MVKVKAARKEGSAPSSLKFLYMLLFICFLSIRQAFRDGFHAEEVKLSSDIPIMSSLASLDSFLDSVSTLYTKYGTEIAKFRPQMREWCSRTKSCKFCDYEAEMLYMLIREHKPQNVFEMAPNRGFSSHWILHALYQNDKTSRLHSFDIHNASVREMDDDYRDRWIFTKGDYAALYDEGKLNMDNYDLIFIDALHEPEFARGYCQRLLANHKRKKTIIAIHDIVADKLGGGRESEEVYKYLAFANNTGNVFTMSLYLMPNLLYSSVANQLVPKINSIRSSMGIVKACNQTMCGNAKHDVLYFDNNDSPTIFFQLN